MKKTMIVSVLFCIALSLVHLYPYLLSQTLNIEHDTFFHISRIEGYAQAIKHGDFIPRIYPLKNNSFGYGSPLFYCDFLLLIPSLLYIWGVSLIQSYHAALFTFTFLSAITMFYTTKIITKRLDTSYLSTVFYIFVNYRVSDVYVRGALGEIMAFAFLPLVLLAAYYLFLREHNKATNWLIISMSGLIFTHNITFVLACIFLLIFIISTKCYTMVLPIVKAALITIAITSFYTFPMLEQLLNHTMVVHLTNSNSLSQHALTFFELFRSGLIYGYSGYSHQPTYAMVVNPGLILLILPLFQIKQSNKFTRTLILLGYFFLLFTTKFIPWEIFSFLGVIQFPWRFMGLVVVLLCIPAAQTLANGKHKVVPYLVVTLLILHHSIQLQSVESRPILLDSNTTYSQIIEGDIVDPYYSATYKRVELAGGDYLPYPSVDYRQLDPCIYTLSFELVTCDIEINYLSSTFTLDASNISQTLLLPKTYFKGYVLKINDETYPTQLDEDTGLVSTKIPVLPESTQITLTYQATPLQLFSILFSIFTLILLCFTKLNKRRKSK